MQKPASFQLINFCLEPFIKSVTTSSLACDGYSPTNLTSTTPQTRSKGFRVEHFMRPPIHIDFEFKVPVQVAYIVVSPNLDEDIEMRLEVSGSFQTTSEYQYKLCGGAVVKSEQSLLVLKNRAYQARELDSSAGGGVITEAVKNVFGSFMSFSLVGVQLIEQPLKHANILVKLRQLRLTVSRMSGPKPVSLKAVEVWGTLSKSSSRGNTEAFQTALSVLQSASTPLGVYGNNVVDSPRDVAVPMIILKDSQCVSDYLHSSGCNTGSQGQHNTLSMLERGDNLYKSQHTCPVETTKESVRNFRSSDMVQQGQNAAQYKKGGRHDPLCGMKERERDYHLKQSLMYNNLSQEYKQGTGTSRGGHFSGCTNEVIHSTEKPSLFNNTNIGSGRDQTTTTTSTRGELSHFSRLPVEPTCSRTTSSCTCSSNRSHLQQCIGCTRVSVGSVNTDQAHSLSGISACTFPLHSTVAYTTTTSACSDEGSERNKTPGVSSGHSPTVPSRLLDEITCEVLQIPMLLPSGHYVDRSTVDRLAHHDAIYGRPPLDPFTGIAFTDSIKPEFCPKLKLQLDEYLLSRQVKHQTTATCTAEERGRTVGSAKEITSHLKMIQGCAKEGVKRSRSEWYVSEPKRTKVAVPETLDTAVSLHLYQQAPLDTTSPVPPNAGPIPTTSECPSFKGNCLDQLTTSIGQRKCDHTEWNDKDDDDHEGSTCSSCGGGDGGVIQPSGSGGAGAIFECEVMCSLDRALEKVLPS